MTNGWGKSKDILQSEAEKSKPKTFTTAEIESIVKGHQVKKQSDPSPVCMALYGHDGIGKSGVCLDSRLPSDVQAGKKVIVLDLDGSCGPLKMKYFPKDDNILTIDPFELDAAGEIDYVSSYNKLLAMVKYIYENEASLNLATVALDGLDTLLKTCEYVMRYEDLKIDPQVQIKDQWQWANRNRRFLVPIFMLRRLKCRKLFTTHYKEVKKYAGGQLTHIGWVPDWEKSIPGIMFQRVLCERIGTAPHIVFKATVEKAKGALELEGKEYTIAEVHQVSSDKTNVKWIGLTGLFAHIEEAAKNK